MFSRIMLMLMLMFSACILNVACESTDAQRYPLHIADSTYSVELATTPDERQQGLMFRESLPADHGMLFVFPDSQTRSFWMRNTYIDLSIAYIDANGIIIDILDMKALNESPVPSSGPAKYALELNKGAFRGIYPGDRVDFSDIPLP